MASLSADDIFIAVMGLTGSGKSTFVSMATNTTPPPQIAQLESCTLGVTVASFHHKYGKTVHLIDTPGFNDTYRTDGDILHELAFWLLKCHTHDIRLSGVVYLHNIIDNRIQGSSLRALNVFKGLVGEENYHGVVLVTTMWDKIDDNDYDGAKERQKELMTQLNFWGDMKQGRSHLKALTAGRTSVEEIVNHIAAENKRLTLRIQRQMSEPENCHIHETDAGKVLYKKLYEEKRNMEQKLDDLKKQLAAAVKNHNTLNARELRKQLQEISESVTANEELIDEFVKPTTELNIYFDEQLQKDLQRVEKMIAANNKRREELERDLLPVGPIVGLNAPHTPIKRNRSMVTLKPQGNDLDLEGLNYRKNDPDLEGLKARLQYDIQLRRHELEVLQAERRHELDVLQAENEKLDRKKALSLANRSLRATQGGVVIGIVGTALSMFACCIM
ncbi:P-loop containing nucleoside triphosphate hydrolase protein [Terfezia claveryi]|nr:P-loop containing nucleoside triphosphate hydrolase protein [Terfezia claveryi]